MDCNCTNSSITNFANLQRVAGLFYSICPHVALMTVALMTVALKPVALNTDLSCHLAGPLQQFPPFPTPPWMMLTVQAGLHKLWMTLQHSQDSQAPHPRLAHRLQASTHPQRPLCPTRLPYSHTPHSTGTQASAAAQATGPSLAHTGMSSSACVATASAGTPAQGVSQVGEDEKPVSLLKRGMRLLTGGGKKTTKSHTSNSADPPVLALPAESKVKRLVMKIVGF